MRMPSCGMWVGLAAALVAGGGCSSGTSATDVIQGERVRRLERRVERQRAGRRDELRCDGTGRSHELRCSGTGGGHGQRCQSCAEYPNAASGYAPTYACACTNCATECVAIDPCNH